MRREAHLATIVLECQAEPIPPISHCYGIMTTEEQQEEKKDDDSTMPQSYGLVQEQYTKLENAIQQFQESTSALLASQKSCLLAASKSHLQNQIMPDIKALQETVEAKERSIATDERLMRSQEERDWFKKEALHLDKTVEKLKREKKALQERIQDLEQDKRWMEKQLKLAARQQKTDGSS